MRGGQRVVKVMESTGAENQPAGRRGHGMPGRSGPPGNLNAKKTGEHTVRRELKELVTRSMDGRTTEARDVAEWTAAVATDLGGSSNLSQQEKTLLDLAARSKLQLDRIDAWLFRQPALVNKRTRALHPVVVQRQTLVTTLRTLLNDLGLKRRAKDCGNLADYLAEKRNGSSNGADASTHTDAKGEPSDEEKPV